MKPRQTIRRSGLLITGLFALFGSAAALADAGDTISNLATINYSVGGVAQTPIESSPTGNTTAGIGNGTVTSFIEDRVINFSVTEAGVVGYNGASPNQQDVALQFTVTNNSNTTLDFLLAAIDTDLDTHNGGAADTLDANNVQVFVEDGTTPGFQLAEDTAVFVDELAEGANATVYIIGDIPAGATNGQTAGYALVAQVAAGGAAAAEGAAITNDDNGNTSPAGTYSNGGTVVVAGTANNIADVAGSMQTVFNDPAGAAAEDWSTAGAQDVAQNGQAADSDAWQINAAQLTVTKTSTVISDPVNGTTNPKAIPGAVMEYTVTVSNGAGAGTAQAIAVTDSLVNEIVTNGTLAYVTGSYNAQGTCPGGGAPNPCGILVTAPTINGGAAQAVTNTNGDGDGGDFTANVVNMVVGNLNGGENATVQFRVTVQ